MFKHIKFIYALLIITIIAGAFTYYLVQKGQSVFYNTDIVYKIPKNENKTTPKSICGNMSTEHFKTITASNLQGDWFTPHAAPRNITFFTENNKFEFHSGDFDDNGNNEKYTGTYSIDGMVVTLKFDDKTQKNMVLNFSQDQTSLNIYGCLNSYLTNDNIGEAYVKNQ